MTVNLISYLLVSTILVMGVQAADVPSVDVNQALGTIVVRAYPEAMRNVDILIKKLKEKYNKQIVIEAKLIEVKLSNEYKFGLDLNLPRLNVTSTLQGIKYYKNKVAYQPTANEPGDQAFEVFLQHLSSQGKVTVLSSPRIVTLNAQKAIMKVGEEKFFALDTKTTITQRPDTISNSSISTKPFFSGIALDVTPEILSDDEVILHIHPIISDVTPEELSAEISNQANRITVPVTSVRESDQMIRAHSGEFIAIGGLVRRKTVSNHNRLPGDKLDRSAEDKSEVSELVIVLRPQIINTETDKKALALNRDFGNIMAQPRQKPPIKEYYPGEKEQKHRHNQLDLPNVLGKPWSKYKYHSKDHGKKTRDGYMRIEKKASAGQASKKMRRVRGQQQYSSK